MSVMKRTKIHAHWRHSLACLFVLLLLGGGCTGGPDDRTLLLDQLESMKQALEDKDRASFMQHLSVDFLGRSHLRRANVDGLLRWHFRRNERISVSLMDIDIAIMTNTAEADFKAMVSGSSGVLPERARVVHMRTQWRKTDDTWQVVRATWDDMLGASSR